MAAGSGPWPRLSAGASTGSTVDAVTHSRQSTAPVAAGRDVPLIGRTAHHQRHVSASVTGYGVTMLKLGSNSSITPA